MNKRGRSQPLRAYNLLEKTVSKQVNGRRKQLITGKENRRVSGERMMSGGVVWIRGSGTGECEKNVEAPALRSG